MIDRRTVKPSVTFLITSLNYGGAENQVAQLAQRLKRRGWKPSVISIIPPVAFVDQLNKEAIPVASLEMTSKSKALFAAKRLLDLLAQFEPQLLHTHLFHANLAGRLTRPFHNLPLVSTIHNSNEGGRHRKLAYRLTDALSITTTVISQRAAELHLRQGVVSSKRSRILPNGVDIQAFAPLAETRRRMRQKLGLGPETSVLLTVGRLVEVKDYPNLFRALQHVIEQHPELVLLLVGSGALETELRQLATHLGVADHIRFLGDRDDVPDLMNAADLYVMASAWEGLPMVLLEASACELPIVATDVGGTGEIVVDGRTGYLVPAQNPRALATALDTALKLPKSARRALGKFARHHATQHYDLEKVVDRWERLYLELLGGSHRDPS